MTKYLKILNMAILLSIGFFSACVEDDEIIVPVNALVASAGDDQTVEKQNMVILDGSGSYDGNEKPFSYSWTIKSKPDSSNTTLIHSDSVHASFLADVKGNYTVELTITQPNGQETWSSKDEVLITVVPGEEPGNGNGEPQTGTVVLNSNIETNRILENIYDDDRADYVVTADIIVNATLTINPGVIIAFEQDKGLSVYNGTIIAKGSAEQNIIFKGKVAGKGYWKGLLISNANPNNEFDHVTIDGGGSSSFSEMYGIKGNLLLAGSDISASAVKLTNSTVSKSGGYGLYLRGAADLNAFDNNIFHDNSYAAARIPADKLQLLGNSEFLSGSGFNGIETEGSVQNDEPVSWPKNNYLVTGRLLLYSGVTIAPGSLFKMQPQASIQVYNQGFLNATGTSDNEIVFTTTSAPYYWGGIYINTTSEFNKLHHCIISYAGNEVFYGMGYAANVASLSGNISLKYSKIKNGLGYGVIVKTMGQINSDVMSYNSFENFVHGNILPDMFNYPDFPGLVGEWLDSYSMAHNKTIGTLYDVTSGTWFEGAESPWAMDNGFGLKIDANNNFVWTIAVNTSVVNCPSYNVEYITGTLNDQGGIITFEQNYWRSRFDSSCDPSQNADMEVEPYTHSLRYEYVKLYDHMTGEPIWELKFYNPDNSTFSYYRR